ncbi:transcriptional regulatory protein GAL4 [Microdochium nivale]|nr:transcriptional regulatory protein GAL4 [Microdochium nivale]
MVGSAAFINSAYFLMHNWIHHIGVAISKLLYDQRAFGAYLGENRSEDGLRQMARMVCINTAQPVDDDLPGMDWVAQFSGSNLRWESIGLLFTFWDLTRRARRTECKPSSEDAESWARIREILHNCLDLCDDYSSGNLILLNLTHRRTMLESMTSGDASLRTGKAHAHTIACLTFLGYHAEAPTDPYVPTLVSELKRVVFASIYGADMTFSSFTGRPPLMPKAYATIPLPLDLDDRHLFGAQEHLQKMASTTLDERGWSKEGTLFGATCYRARGMLKTIREEILAIALGHSDQETSVDMLLGLSQRQAAMIDEFPASLAFRPEDINKPEIPSVIVFTQLMICMESLQNDFFLDRLLLKRGYSSYAHLLLTSYKMVSNTLLLWTNFERFAIMKTNFQWMLMAYGAPAGGILCKELQKPTLLDGRHPEDPKITRSAIIQKLSLLVGFLDWVDPAAPNADLCSDCKTVIKLVLDQTLNGGSGLEALSMASQIEFEFPRGLDFNFELMDSFDWLSSEL